MLSPDLLGRASCGAEGHRGKPAGAHPWDQRQVPSAALPSLWGQLAFKHPQGEEQVTGRCLISSLGGGVTGLPLPGHLSKSLYQLLLCPC